MGLVLAASSAACDDDPFGPSCFVRGTRVRTPRGSVAIEDLVVGDDVLSLRTSDLAIVTRKVTHVLRAVAREVRRLVIGDVTLTTTDEHPFWDAERRTWTRACDLAAGTVVVRLDREGRPVPAVVLSNAIERRAETPVFNLTVEGPEHTYFAEDVAVHNKTVCAAPCVDPPVPDPTSAAVKVRDLDVLLHIERSVIEGTQKVPLDLSLASNALVHAVTLKEGETITPTGTVTVVNGGVATPEPASIVTFDESSESFLVVGRGVATHRRIDGKLALVTGSPNLLIRKMTNETPVACGGTAAISKLRWKAPPPSTVRHTVRSLSWNDVTSCVAVDFDDEATLEACLPKDAWPFTVGQALLIPTAGNTPNRLEIVGPEGSDTTLALQRAPFVDVGLPLRVDGLELELEAVKDCASLDKRCGTVRVPVTAQRSVATSLTPIALGAPFGDRPKTWLVSAFASPISHETCTSDVAPAIAAPGIVELVTLYTPAK